MPGAFANVKSTCRATVPLTIPSGALIFDQKGLRVATVGADDRVLLKPVTISRDLGQAIEIASGLPPTIASSSPRRTASPTAIRSVSPARPRR